MASSAQSVSAAALAERGALVDERHLAEHPAGADALHDRAADRDRDPAFEHHVHEGAGLALRP